MFNATVHSVDFDDLEPEHTTNQADSVDHDKSGDEEGESEKWHVKLRNVFKGAKEGDGKRMLSMFLVGLTLLQPYHAASSGSRFAIRRFGVPVSHSSIYVSKFHTACHTFNMLGIVLVNFYMWIFGSKNLRFNPLLSVFSNFLTFAFDIVLLIAYLVRRNSGALTFYYWVSTACAFLYGANRALVVSVGVEHLAFFTCGVQVAGIQVTLFQTIFLNIARFFPDFDVNYWLIPCQILLATLVALISLVLWNVAFGQKDLYHLLRGKTIQGDERDRVDVVPSNSRTESVQELGDKSHDSVDSFNTLNSCEVVKYSLLRSIKRAIAPILMSGISTSFIFAFYPSVSPYKLTPLDTAHKIDLTVLIVAAIPPTVISALCALGVGPDRKWEKDHFFWHYFLYLLIPYFLLILFFLIAMHYPENRFSKVVRNPFFHALCIDSSIGIYSLLKSVGFAGVGLQEGRRNGPVSTFNVLFCFLLLFTCAFWGSGYIKIYKRFETDSGPWPTSDMTWVKSLLFWFFKSFVVGFGNFKRLLTDDLLRDILELNQD